MSKQKPPARPFGMWDVKGSFLIPGSREKGTFGPIRIGDRSKQDASKVLARGLNEHFRKELKGDAKFSDHFALMNMRWDEVKPAPTPLPAEVPAVPLAEAANAVA